MKILVVEDEPTTRAVLTDVVAEYGECDAVADGREALAQFYSAHDEGKPYDIMLLDLVLPVLDGQSVFGAIRTFEEERNISGERTIRVVVITGSSDTENTFEAFSSGCESFLVKPIDRAKLKRIMKGLR